MAKRSPKTTAFSWTRETFLAKTLVTIFAQRFHSALATVLGAILFIVSQLGSPQAAGGNEVVYSRDIAPIFATHCFQCHGPDAESRQGDLNLSDLGAALRAEPALLVAKRPEQSQLFQRITSADDKLRMPPSEHAAALSAEMIRIWVEQGAKNSTIWGGIRTAISTLVIDVNALLSTNRSQR